MNKQCAVTQLLTKSGMCAMFQQMYSWAADLRYSSIPKHTQKWDKYVDVQSMVLACFDKDPGTLYDELRIFHALNFMCMIAHQACL